jgi:prepilin-type N-terminal cleavage/methylation domain-containing protein
MNHTIRAGLTLIELSIASAIFAMIAGVAGQSLISGTSMSSDISRSSILMEDTNRVLQRIAGQLRSADYNWIYLNEGTVSTYTFKVCTGLGVSDTGEIGPRFDQTYTVAYDSINGTLTATLADQTTGSILNQEIAQDLRTPDGFRVGQLGTDVLVKGNQLQLALARYARDQHGNIVTVADGTPRVFESTTTIFLRSTIYANTNLTTTTTDAGSDAGSSGTDSTPESPKEYPAPTIALGSDTDTQQKKVGTGQSAVYANSLIIVGSVTAASDSDPINFDKFDYRLSKEADGVNCQLSVKRGWVSSENRDKKLLENQFQFTGWVIGSLTITVAIPTMSGSEGIVTQSY